MHTTTHCSTPLVQTSWPAAQVEDFAKAMGLASQTHGPYPRKISGTTYLSHPILAAGITLKTGGTPRAATIALLHDVVEEGGPMALETLQSQFDPDICHAVTYMTPSGRDGMDWKQRKLASLQRMAHAPDTDIAMAFAGDKAATLLELEWDCAHMGHSMVLSGLRDGDQLIWYYQSCVEQLSSKVLQAMRSVLQQKLTWLTARLNCQPEK